ncbi:MAG: hypothetical protein HKN74_08405 [Acidimicrobiia bacterium]|nr:hypothetical protein [Acidimicrobiia bacterium]NNF10290.1 hypothetical protein [Acidimicrobiia bacterium]NNL71267.1 hypothetical protein [Acidimicrobiia bacterium]
MTTGGRGLVKQTHPIRGALWGLMLGLGLAIVLVVTTVIELNLAQIILAVIVGMAIGVGWSLFGPARRPRGGAAPPPLQSERLADKPEDHVPPEPEADSP